MVRNTIRVSRSGTPRGTMKVRMAEKRALTTSATPTTKTTAWTTTMGVYLPFCLSPTPHYKEGACPHPQHLWTGLQGQVTLCAPVLQHWPRAPQGRIVQQASLRWLGS